MLVVPLLFAALVMGVCELDLRQIVTGDLAAALYVAQGEPAEDVSPVEVAKPSAS